LWPQPPAGFVHTLLVGSSCQAGRSLRDLAVSTEKISVQSTSFREERKMKITVSGLLLLLVTLVAITQPVAAGEWKKQQAAAPSGSTIPVVGNNQASCSPSVAACERQLGKFTPGWLSSDRKARGDLVAAVGLSACGKCVKTCADHHRGNARSLYICWCKCNRKYPGCKPGYDGYC